MSVVGSSTTVTSGSYYNGGATADLIGINVYSASGWPAFSETGAAQYSWDSTSNGQNTPTYTYDFTNWPSGTPIAVLLVLVWGWQSESSYTIPSGCSSFYSSISNPGVMAFKCNQVAGTSYTLSMTFPYHASFGYIAVAFPYGSWG